SRPEARAGRAGRRAAPPRKRAARTRPEARACRPSLREPAFAWGCFRVRRGGALFHGPAHPRLREGRHAGVAGNRRLEDRDRERRAGRLAKPHAEVEQRPLTQDLEEPPMTRLGGDMGNEAVIERPWIEGVEDR